MSSINVSVFRPKGRAFYQAQWVDPVTGRKRTRSTGTPNKRDADRFAGRLEADLRAGTYEGQQKTAWQEFRRRYEADVVPAMAKGTGEKVRAMFRAVERIVDPKKLASLNADQISRYASELRTEGKAESTIKGHLAYLKCALRWAKGVGMLAAVPKITMPKRTAGMKGRPITAEEFERMLKKVPAVRSDETAESWRFLLRGLWWSGLRLGEALSLHWTDDSAIGVDLTGKYPMFKIRAEAEKGYKDRLLPMAPEFAEMLRAVPESERHGFVFNPEPMQPGVDRLGQGIVCRRISDIGEKATVKVAERKVTRDGKEETVVKWASAHDLRRAFGFRWSQRVMPAVLQQMMRHESIQTTMEFYVGKNSEAAAEAIWSALANTLANTTPETTERPTNESAERSA